MSNTNQHYAYFIVYKLSQAEWDEHCAVAQDFSIQSENTGGTV